MDESLNSEIAGFISIVNEYKKSILTKSSSSTINNDEEELKADMEMLKRYLARQILEDSGFIFPEINQEKI